MIVYCISLQTNKKNPTQRWPYWTDEVGVLCICRGWHAAVVAAAGNWVVTALFISPVVRLARRPAGFSRASRTFAGLSGDVTPPFALSLGIKRGRKERRPCVGARVLMYQRPLISPLWFTAAAASYRHAGADDSHRNTPHGWIHRKWCLTASQPPPQQWQDSTMLITLSNQHERWMGHRGSKIRSALLWGRR